MSAAENCHDGHAEKAVLTILAAFPKETIELLTEETVTRDWFFCYPEVFDTLQDLATRRLVINFTLDLVARRFAGLADERKERLLTFLETHCCH